MNSILQFNNTDDGQQIILHIFIINSRGEMLVSFMQIIAQYIMIDFY